MSATVVTDCRHQMCHEDVFAAPGRFFCDDCGAELEGLFGRAKNTQPAGPTANAAEHPKGDARALGREGVDK